MPLRPDAGRRPEPHPAPAATDTAAPLRVAFQGEPGALSEDAIIQHWGGAAEPVPMATFADVMDAAEGREVDYGLLPIESTLMGGVDSAYDLLAMHDGLSIVGETVVPVELVLVALPGATLSGVRVVSSHPLTLAQCANFFDRHRRLTQEPAWDTAGAARLVSESGDRSRAAVASRRAAERFGLEVLAERLEDRADTQMRFLVVASEAAAVESGTPARTAVLCTVREVAGALVAALQPLATHGFNVSHFAARPTREPWQYQYFIEFEHEAGDARAAEALGALRAASTTSRVLGTFPCFVHPPERGRS